MVFLNSLGVVAPIYIEIPNGMQCKTKIDTEGSLSYYFIPDAKNSSEKELYISQLVRSIQEDCDNGCYIELSQSHRLAVHRELSQCKEDVAYVQFYPKMNEGRSPFSTKKNLNVYLNGELMEEKNRYTFFAESTTSVANNTTDQPQFTAKQ